MGHPCKAKGQYKGNGQGKVNGQGKAKVNGKVTANGKVQANGKVHGKVHGKVILKALLKALRHRHHPHHYRGRCMGKVLATTRCNPEEWPIMRERMEELPDTEQKGCRMNGCSLKGINSIVRSGLGSTTKEGRLSSCPLHTVGAIVLPNK